MSKQGCVVQWPESFTAEEVSAVMSCLANHFPLCCEEHFWRVRTVTNDPTKQDVLATYAYENWGCEPGIWFGPMENASRSDRYFERALETVVELWRP